MEGEREHVKRALRSKVRDEELASFKDADLDMLGSNGFVEEGLIELAAKHGLLRDALPGRVALVALLQERFGAPAPAAPVPVAAHSSEVARGLQVLQECQQRLQEGLLDGQQRFQEAQQRLQEGLLDGQQRFQEGLLEGQQRGFQSLEQTLREVIADVSRKLTVTEEVAMSVVSTGLAEKIVETVGLVIYDGSTVEPVEDISVPKGYEFEMGNYRYEKDCYDPLFEHMAKYLGAVHKVEIMTKVEKTTRRSVCRLLDVHDTQTRMGFEVDLADHARKIVGRLDGVFVPATCGKVAYFNRMIGGIEVKHSDERKAKNKQIATSSYGKGGFSRPTGQALMEALAVYALSDFPEGIFLLTSFDDNLVMELRENTICYWANLNFAQAMDKVAKFLKSDLVLQFLQTNSTPYGRKEKRVASKEKEDVRKKLKIGINESFLEQLDVIRSFSGSEEEKMANMFELVESWRHSTDEVFEGCNELLSYFS